MIQHNGAAGSVVRLRVAGWLRTQSALHIGDSGRDPNATLATAVDGRGRLCVPGSSLAGALRSLLHADPAGGDGPRDEAANHRWGWAEQGGQDGAVSRIVVGDALVAAGPELDGEGLPARPLSPARLESRTSVGIDRRHGAAAQGILFTRSVIPRGVWLRLELDLRSDARNAGDDSAYLARLLALLAAGQLRLGAAVTRGLGRTRLAADRTTVHTEQLDSPRGLFAVLRGDSEHHTADRWIRDHGTETPQAAARHLEIRVSWRPLAPVMVRSGVDGLTVDTLPLTTAGPGGPGDDGETVTLVLPGTSLKGALRSRAEHIERTARGTDAPAADTEATRHDTSGSAAFREQLDQLPAVRALFGSAPRHKGDRGRGRGALLVDDCHAESEIPAELWDLAHQPDAAAALVRLREYGLERADHVAIDRWTGGAADGLLYSVLEPHGLTWSPITLTVDLRRLAGHAAAHATTTGPETGQPEVPDAALALLLLVLRDLKAGRLPLGGSTHRGMGDVAVDEILLTFPDDDPSGGTPVELDAFLLGEETGRLTDAWSTYLDGAAV
ncbi:hypothetical protein JGS22_021990 [Streptomyces sp. P38-E01]|uniref:CRISPR type III-associated protein domain-containing protein n=1 Tax=Streptomyces tardus TaxID=2780544 RepID=A0A949N6P4_9ACTN|nr:RAMP superfamily CRISPR-associated protein [Streptomyces tardus]MBU7600229.1 hypothetical protein [Streptomyces tardus]